MSVGVGMGNYNDVLLEQLADQGDGFYAYINDLAEARRLFTEDLVGTLQTVALDARPRSSSTRPWSRPTGSSATRTGPSRTASFAIPESTPGRSGRATR